MARDFTTGNPDYLKLGSAPVVTYPFTISWYPRLNSSTSVVTSPSKRKQHNGKVV